MKLRAYFSHSYRWEQKELNHHIWNTLNSHFYFAVDPPDVDREPMQVAYLETMMMRSACFIAVIGRRDDLGPQLCSPYQLFENALAIRARRPRLLIIADDIDAALLGPEPEAVVRFEASAQREGLAWFERPRNDETLRETIEKFRNIVRSTPIPPYNRGGPIGLALPRDDNYLRQRQLDAFLTTKLAKQPKWLDLTRGTEGQLLRDVEECSLIVQEVRGTTHTPLDIQGLLHARFRPTVLVCRLEGDETIPNLEAAMRLPHDRMAWSQTRPDLPILYAGYRVGTEMQPVVFWREHEQLFDALEHHVLRIRNRHKDLEKDGDATKYFLSLGRVPGKVFVSHENSSSAFVDELCREFDSKGIEYYHYRAPDAKRGGEPDFPDALKRRINEAAVFLTLINSAYAGKRWCMQELALALERANDGRLAILPFLLEENAPVPAHIAYLDAPHLYEHLRTPEPHEKACNIVVAEILKHLDSNKRLRFARDELELLDTFRSQLPADWRKRLRDIMAEATVPQAEIDVVLGLDNADATDVWDRLVELARRSYRAANALGQMLTSFAADMHVTYPNGPEFDQDIVQLAQRHRLMPDVRSMLEPAHTQHEVGITWISTLPAAETFEGIANGQPVSPAFTGAGIDDALYASLVRVAASYEKWPEIITDAAASLRNFQPVCETARQVDQFILNNGSMIGREDIGFCILGDESGLQVPFEWARRGGASPIYLEQPVRRVLMGVANKRPSLRTLMLAGQARPLRVLLIGNDAGNIPNVEIEVQRIEARLLERFRQLRWPLKNIKALTGPVASWTLEQEISRGGFDLLHIAAHGVVTQNEPSLQLRGPDGNYLLSAQELGNWINRSELRFAYLNCCRSAAPETGTVGQPMRRFDNLIQAFVKGGVPEVLGFVWPIDDKESSRFADVFYTGFAKNFRAGLALLKARQEFRTNERISAAPVLYSQSDTQYT